MTEADSSRPARTPRTPGPRRRHAAAATRLVIGAAALAGTLDLVALMGAGADLSSAETATIPDPFAGAALATAPPSTVAPPTTPETIVIVRRHVIVAGSDGRSSTQSTRSSATRIAGPPPATAAAAPAPALAPAPAPVTTTKGS